MQNKKLLETGNYMVVSVNDEIYEKMLGGDILYRSRGELSSIFINYLLSNASVFKLLTNSKALRLI